MPGGERQPPQGVGRRLSHIERDEPEVAGREHECERPDGLLHRALVHIAAQTRMGRDMTADPEQAVEIEAGGRGRLDIEHVERVDERHQFSTPAGRGQQAQQQARAARRSRADDLGELPAREPASEFCVQSRNTRGTDGVFIVGVERRQGRRERAVELTRTEQRFEMGGCAGHNVSLYLRFLELYRTPSGQSSPEARAE